eukprot:TRINITY_DN23430_c0_g2_i2.p1 TRINITY_DN23430_c0_g2~~TRINITY_DN23430_c0_g2_i2.p1  ORF type:complete len:427 (+),score=103.63 TRINITY_DN23430_c0_g2_i2:67-1281(+)
MGAAWCGSVEDPTQGAAEAQHEPPVLAPAAVGQLEVAAGLTPGDAEASAPAVHAEKLEGGKLEDGKLEGVASVTLADGEASARAGLESEEGLMRNEMEGRTEVSGGEAYARKGITGAKKWDVRAREDARRQRQAEAAAAIDHPGPHQVWLNVYSLRPVGYHSAVSVCGVEVYFDGTAAGFASDLSRPGIQVCNPECGPIGQFQEPILMGESPFSSHRIGRIVAEMAPQWSIGSYHLLYQNCNHFAEAMLNLLGCPGRPPVWVNRAANWAGVLIPDCLFNWAARRTGLQRQRLDTGREHCGCGARFGLCTTREYCSACGYPSCGQCLSNRRVVPLYGPNPVPVCGYCVDRYPAPPAAGAPAPEAPPAPAAAPAAPAQGGATVPLSVAARRATLEAPSGGGCCSHC